MLTISWFLKMLKGSPRYCLCSVPNILYLLFFNMLHSVQTTYSIISFCEFIMLLILDIFLTFSWLYYSLLILILSNYSVIPVLCLIVLFPLIVVNLFNFVNLKFNKNSIHFEITYWKFIIMVI